MMKFLHSKIDLNPIYDRINDKTFNFSARGIPTVDEVNEALASMTADTILQVIKGQAIYFGYECERHCENGIPKCSDDSKIMANERRSKLKRRRNNKKVLELKQQMLATGLEADYVESLLDNVIYKSYK